MTALTVYPTSTNATTVTTGRTLATSPPAAEASTTTKVGKGTGWGNLFPQGSTATWAALGASPAIGANNAVYILDATTLEGQTLAAGTYTPKIKVSCSSAITMAILCHVGVRSSSGTYTPIGSSQTTATAFAAGVAQALTLPAITGAATDLATGDKLVLDFDAQVTVATASNTATISLFMNGGTAEQVTTPGYAATVVALSGTGTGALTLTGSAGGSPAITDTATGVLGLTAQATGTVTGSASAGLTLTASATGTVTGTAPGALTFVAQATGAPDTPLALTGTGTGNLTLIAQASGVPAVIGTAAALLTLTAQASGTVAGTAHGAVTLTAQAAGIARLTGTATAALALLAQATGTGSAPTTLSGTGTALLALVAQAVGVKAAAVTVTVISAGTGRVGHWTATTETDGRLSTTEQHNRLTSKDG